MKHKHDMNNIYYEYKNLVRHFQMAICKGLILLTSCELAKINLPQNQCLLGDLQTQQYSHS